MLNRDNLICPIITQHFMSRAKKLSLPCQNQQSVLYSNVLKNLIIFFFDSPILLYHQVSISKASLLIAVKKNLPWTCFIIWIKEMANVFLKTNNLNIYFSNKRCTFQTLTSGLQIEYKERAILKPIKNCWQKKYSTPSREVLFQNSVNKRQKLSYEGTLQNNIN